MSRLLLALFITWFACAGAQAASVTTVSQGTRHDALYGLCLDGQQGIAVGDAGMLLHSSDGGENWTPAAPLAEAALLDVNCGGGPQFIVGQEGLIFRRDGDQFQRLESASDQRLLAVSSNKSGLAFAVGGFGTVLRSTDGGDSWEALTFDWEGILNDFLEPHIYTVQVTEDGLVTIAGEFALIMQSPDGGDSWQVVNHGEASIFGMHLQGDRGYAVGQDGTVLRSTDGGASWTAVTIPSGANLLDVWSSGDDLLVAGIRAVLYSADGGVNWQSIDEGDFSVGWYQRMGASAASESGGDAILLAGHGGRIVKLELEANQ